MARRRLLTALNRARNQLRHGLSGRRSDHDLVAAVAAALPAGPVSVVLINPAATSRLSSLIGSSRPDAVIHDVSGAESDRHVQLALLGPVDLIVDERPGPGQLKRLLASFYQLRAGGAMILCDWRAGGAKLADFLTAARAAQGQPYPSNKRGIPRSVLDAHGLGTVLESTTEVGSHLVVTSRGGPVLAKFREDEMNRYLAGLPAGGDRVLEVIPARPFESRCVLRENTRTRRPHYPERYETIDLSLRLYHDMVVTPGQVLSNDRVLTPDTYRHNQFPRLRNRYTREVAPRFARLAHETADLPSLAGTYFYLDNEIRGHFGHLVTEQMSRFWGWSRAKAFDPSVKAVVAINKGHELRVWESEIYAAGGIAPEDVVFLREPARLERVISGTPMLSNPDYVHPAIAETWRAVGDHLAANADDIEVPERFFCSRRLNKRSCHNTGEVEELFAAQGFSIVFPEDYSLGEQVKLFRGARVIGGFAGSGLFNLCYTTDPKRVIMISSTAYTARNEYLFASVLGHRIDSVTCVPDDPTFYQSPFTFDADREGAFLAEVFASL